MKEIRKSLCPHCISLLKGIMNNGTCECHGLYYSDSVSYQCHEFGGIAVFVGEKFHHFEFMPEQHDYEKNESDGGVPACLDCVGKGTQITGKDCRSCDGTGLLAQ